MRNTLVSALKTIMDSSIMDRNAQLAAKAISRLSGCSLLSLATGFAWLGSQTPDPRILTVDELFPAFQGMCRAAHTCFFLYYVTMDSRVSEALISDPWSRIVFQEHATYWSMVGTCKCALVDHVMSGIVTMIVHLAPPTGVRVTRGPQWDPQTDSATHVSGNRPGLADWWTD